MKGPRRPRWIIRGCPACRGDLFFEDYNTIERDLLHAAGFYCCLQCGRGYGEAPTQRRTNDRRLVGRA